MKALSPRIVDVTTHMIDDTGSALYKARREAEAGQKSLQNISKWLDILWDQRRKSTIISLPQHGQIARTYPFHGARRQPQEENAFVIHVFGHP